MTATTATTALGDLLQRHPLVFFRLVASGVVSLLPGRYLGRLLWHGPGLT